MERVPGKACCPWSSQNSPPSVKTGWGPSETMPISHSPQVPSQSPLTLSQSVDGRFTEWEIFKLSLTPCVKLKIANYLYDILVLCFGALFHFGSRCQVKDLNFLKNLCFVRIERRTNFDVLFSEYSSQLPTDGGTFYHPDTIDNAKPHYKKRWTPILHALAIWLHETGFAVGEMNKEKSSVPANAPANVKREEINSDKFYLILGIIQTFNSWSNEKDFFFFLFWC